MNIRASTIIVSGLILSGCATSTGIVPTGNGEFFLSKQGGASMNWSGGVIKAELLREAMSHCKASGRDLDVISERSIDATLYNYPSAELRFRCR